MSLLHVVARRRSRALRHATPQHPALEPRGAAPDTRSRRQLEPYRETLRPHGAVLAVGQSSNGPALAALGEEQVRVRSPTGRLQVPRRPIDELGQEDGHVGRLGPVGRRHQPEK